MKIDLQELKKEKKKNFEERLRFIDNYVEWLKRTPNCEWSRMNAHKVYGIRIQPLAFQ